MLYHHQDNYIIPIFTTNSDKKKFFIYQDKYYIGDFIKLSNHWSLISNNRSLLKIIVKSKFSEPLKIKFLKPSMEVSNIDPEIYNGKYKLNYKNLFYDNKLISCKNFIMDFSGKRIIECIKISKDQVLIAWNSPLIDLQIFLIGISVLF